MKVLITGASGRLGAFVIRELAAQHTLVLMSRRQPPREFDHLPFIQGDLNNFEDCQRAVEGVDAIQHLGAQPGPVGPPRFTRWCRRERYSLRCNLQNEYARHLLPHASSN